MALRIVKEYGEEILTKKAKEVENVDERLLVLIEDMIETMHHYNGYGLAAPQVGILKQVIVIDLYDNEGVLVLINPVVIKEKGEQEVEEGCLSFPNQFGKVIRPSEITVEALDKKGRKIKVIGKDLLAQAISHEMDHLNGELFIDKILPGTLEVVTPEEKEKKKEDRKKAV